MKVFIIQVIKKLETFLRIIIKHTLRVCLTVILRSVFSIFNTLKYLFFKHWKCYKYFLELFSNTLLNTLWCCKGSMEHKVQGPSTHGVGIFG